MVSTPYFRGRSREYRVMGALKAKGWRCSRSAMSHGPVDIFAGKDGKILLIQVKSGRVRMSKQEREKLIEWAEAFGAEAEIWYYSRTKGKYYRKNLPSIAY
jgi:Holliday junction resolvase